MLSTEVLNNPVYLFNFFLNRREGESAYEGEGQKRVMGAEYDKNAFYKHICNHQK